MPSMTMKGEIICFKHVTNSKAWVAQAISTGHLRELDVTVSSHYRMDPRATHHSQHSCYLKYVKIVFYPKLHHHFLTTLTENNQGDHMHVLCTPCLVLTPSNDVFLKPFILFSLEWHCHYGTCRVIMVVTKTLSWPRWQQFISVKFHFNIIFPSVSVDPGPGNETGQVGQEAVPHATTSYQWRTIGIIFYYNNCELHKPTFHSQDSSVPTFIDMYTSRNKQVSPRKVCALNS
jgi:hypothetical protein